MTRRILEFGRTSQDAILIFINCCSTLTDESRWQTYLSQSSLNLSNASPLQHYSSFTFNATLILMQRLPI